jgi:ATP/maltotriose-dependent transcriptional regulator MalT/DNA-binding SARP family transcriptional activator
MLVTPASTTGLDAGQALPALLPLKLTAPPPRAGLVLRPDLQARLPDVRLHALTLLVAPAGYGKTTLLAQWAQELKRTGSPVCWLTVDSGERNPAAFLSYLIGAFRTAFPTIGQEALRVLSSAAHLERDWPLVAGSLCSDLQRKMPTAAFLFLDDLHQVIDSAVITQILAYLLRAAPPTLHIVMSSRRAPTFAPIERMRTEGRVIELTQADLHLSVEEVRRILVAQTVELSEPELALLLERTEGWALSVQLAARALATQPEEQRGEFVRLLGGSQEQVLNYLASEVLSELSGEMLEFLRFAAIPAWFDASLLIEVLQRDDVRYLLQRAQVLGLPITAMDEHGSRLRFHPLWREVLQRELTSAVDQETLHALQRRFGRALVARGDLDAALDHYAIAEAHDDLSRVLRERAWPLLLSPQRDMVRRWLSSLPPDMLQRDAELLHLSGVSVSSADPAGALEALDRAVSLYSAEGKHERALQALADMATLIVSQSRSEEFAALCQRGTRVARLVGDAWSRGVRLVCLIGRLYVKGRDDAALRMARHAATLPLNPTWRWLLAMVVGSICGLLGRPHEALPLIDETIQLARVDQDDRLRQNMLRLRGVALYELGNTADGLALVQDSYRHLKDYYMGLGSANGYNAMQVALLLMLQGRVDEAMTFVGQARSAFHDLGGQALLVNLQAIEAYGQLQRGQQSNAVAMVAGIGRRLQEHLPGQADLRVWLLLVQVLGESGEYERALAMVRELLALMEERSYLLFRACALLYGAYLAGRCGEQALRDTWLRTGWELVTANDFRFLPITSAAAVRDVAHSALRSNLEPEAAGQLLRQHLPEQAIELIQSLLSEPDAAVRASAARLLGSMGAVSAYSSLRSLLKDKDPAVRQAGEVALSRLVYRPPYTLKIRTLGAFSLFRGDQEVRDRDWRSSKARQLFQVLLTERGRTLPRERILDLLWPEMDAESAANNLRVTINRLNRAIEPDRPDGAPSSYILQQGDTYSFNMASDHQLDAAAFADAANEGLRALEQGQRRTAITAFRRAVELYQGPFLPDTMYEDWTVVERERLSMLFSEVALNLGTLLLDEGVVHEAIGLGWRVLEHDQTSEEAYRLLMRAHIGLGERSTALRLYARCVSALRSELGIDPMPETQALYQTLRDLT